MDNLYITPCVGVCKVEDGNCIGCKRTIEEIREWNHYSHEDRMTVMKRLGYGKRRKRKCSFEKTLDN